MLVAPRRKSKLAPYYCCGGVVHQLRCHLGFWKSTRLLAKTVVVVWKSRQPGHSLLKLRDLLKTWSGQPVTFGSRLEPSSSVLQCHTCTLPTLHTAFPGHLAKNQGAPICLISSYICSLTLEETDTLKLLTPLNPNGKQLHQCNGSALITFHYLP